MILLRQIELSSMLAKTHSFSDSGLNFKIIVEKVKKAISQLSFRSVVLLFSRSVVRLFGRSFVRLFGRSVVRSRFGCLVGRSLYSLLWAANFAFPAAFQYKVLCLMSNWPFDLVIKWCQQGSFVRFQFLQRSYNVKDNKDRQLFFFDWDFHTAPGTRSILFISLYAKCC